MFIKERELMMVHLLLLLSALNTYTVSMVYVRSFGVCVWECSLCARGSSALYQDSGWLCLVSFAWLWERARQTLTWSTSTTEILSALTIAAEKYLVCASHGPHADKHIKINVQKMCVLLPRNWQWIAALISKLPSALFDHFLLLEYSPYSGIKIDDV